MPGVIVDGKGQLRSCQVKRLSHRLLLVVLIVCGLMVRVDAQKASSFAHITHRNAPVKAGVGVPDAQIKKSNIGEVVEFFGQKGDYAEVRFPGGVVAFVLEKRGSKTFVKLDDKGRARVVVERVSLRPHANMDWPAMGTLTANQNILVLDRAKDNWLRVLAPEAVHVFVHKNYVKLAENQTAAATDFRNRDSQARRVLISGGKISARMQGELEQTASLENRLNAAESKMATSLSTKPSPTALANLRREFEQIQADAPKDSLVARAAGEKVAYLQGKEDTARRFADADAKIRALEDDRKRRESEYQDDLASFRTKKEAEKAKQLQPKSRFLRLGIGTLHKIYLGVGRTPTWVLSKAAESRYHVTSDRYDLGEYHDKKIGITRWKIQPPAPGSKLERVEILRLEILD